MKVAILTMFNGLSHTYSLVNVVAEQLEMLLKNGVKTKVIVSQDCNDDERKGVYADERLEWVKVTNKFNGNKIQWHDYSQPDGQVHETFYDEVEVIASDLEEKLLDVDICIMHDIHYQGWHLVHNVAIRKVQEKLQNIKFIAMTHSVPVNRPSNPKWPFSCRYTPMPNTTYVYPTYSGIPALAKQFNVPEGKCRVVHNSLNLKSFMSKEVRSIHDQVDLISPDILIVYPARFTTGKRFEKVASLAGVIKAQTELKVKVLFCDFPSMDTNLDKYKAYIKNIGNSHGLEKTDIFFTSDLGYAEGFPRSSVLELFTLSNLFICPSYSESFGLTVIEASSRGNFLVLNEAVPALEELGKQLKAYFMRWDARNFGYDTKEIYKPSEQAYLKEHASRIVNLMRDNPVIYAKTLARQKYSPQWVWYNQLEPLLHPNK
ncbi:glycosyltransferase [Natranaerobius trueperi]|uniref:Glycosyltransferase n=1 Tax=Natranaerobius trueperi TaxID=759412 RepID=A0A226BY09_9FIRM|nr:glycosyltransferase [Natranaerobius trueperi]OWZ83825.1 glycosyltransferase [Natranaerobius trueperi]